MLILDAGALLLGLVVGSFLNVVVSRSKTGASPFGGRSRCDGCNTTLRWSDLIPVLSFFWLRGRCRNCGASISMRHPIVEALTGGLFLTLMHRLSTGALSMPPYGGIFAGPFLSLPELSLIFAYYAIFVATAIAIAVFDLEEHLILTGPLLVMLIAGILFQGTMFAITGSGAFLLSSFLVGAAVFSIFWAIWYFSGGRAMGRGDADVAGLMALAIGSTAAIVGYLLAFWIGGIFGILMVVARRLHLRSAVPFAPFLFLGALIALLFAKELNPLVLWYGI